MTNEELVAIGNAVLKNAGPPPAHKSFLRGPVVYVVEARGGKVHTVINDEFDELIQTLRDEGDTAVATTFAMFRENEVDIPSFNFHKALLLLDPENRNTEWLGHGPDGGLVRVRIGPKFPKYFVTPLRERPELLVRAARWFHEKWNIPEGAYRESMEDSLRTDGPVPRWYVMLDGETIIAGLGVIENDFHLRRDLTPNVCAVYVEEEYRKQGLAGQLLTHACNKYASMGIHTLYLATEHTSFYERYGWEFHCMEQEEDSDHMTRMYRKTTL